MPEHDSNSQPEEESENLHTRDWPAEDRQNIEQDIIDRHSVAAGKGRVFCLGPNSGRINFASQQQRAMNLIWALYEKGYLKKGRTTIGIVGAGISGVTAAVALRGLSCPVDLFETKDVLIPVQHATDHRFVHPMINRWPGDTNFSPTTSLPFLNWYVGRCSNVVSDLKSAFLQVQKQNERELNFRENTTIKKFKHVQAPAEGVMLFGEKGSSVGVYDIVIIATGFGLESNNNCTGIETISYWHHDNLYTKRSDSNITEYIVSGVGDGGLMDAIRLLYSYEGDDIAQLFSETISASSKSKRKKCEVCAGIIESLRTQAIPYLDNPRVEQERSQKDLFLGAAKMLAGLDSDHPTKDLLDKRMNGDFQVTLVDSKHTDPYSSNASPVNKLLVAYAHAQGLVHFENGELSLESEEIILTNTSKFIKKFNKESTHVIIRHGAPEYADTIKDDIDWASLKSAQLVSASQNYKLAWEPSDGKYLPVPQIWKCPVTQKTEFCESMRVAAQTVVTKVMRSNGRVIPVEQGYLVVGHTSEFEPDYLFGQPVEWKEATSIEVQEQE